MHGRYKTEIAVASKKCTFAAQESTLRETGLLPHQEHATTLVIQSSNGPFSRGADPPFRPRPERPPFPLTAASYSRATSLPFMA